VNSPEERSQDPINSPIRLLVVDDHKIVREGLVSLLSEQHDIEVVGEAGNGREAISLASRLQPDVVIMDISMPLMSGDEATRQIKNLMPDIRIIALSMFEEEEMMQKMRRAGAENYVLKTAPSGQLLSAIRGGELTIDY
jgi:DNA-binding NarL/FixJ family response regulator